MVSTGKQRKHTAFFWTGSMETHKNSNFEFTQRQIKVPPHTQITFLDFSNLRRFAQRTFWKKKKIETKVRVSEILNSLYRLVLEFVQFSLFFQRKLWEIAKTQKYINATKFEFSFC